MRTRSGSGRSRCHIIGGAGRRELRSTPASETNKHDKSSANVTAANRITATTTTCCLEKHQHNRSIHAQPHHQREQQEQGHSGRHLARHGRGKADNCDCQRARDNYSYKWPFSSSSGRRRYLGGAGKSDDTSSRRLLMSDQPARALGRKSTCVRIISPLLPLVLLALAHFHCHSTVITSSLAAPAADPHASSINDGGAILRPFEERLDGAFDQLESGRAKLGSLRDVSADKINVNVSNVFGVIFKKRPYSKYWTAEQKWDDLFRRMMAVQGTLRQMMMKNLPRDIEYYADLSISPQCEKDLKFIQNYAKDSTNFRWLAHMFDSTGKSEPGMLTGMLAHLGHPVQCIKVRAPARPSNDTFNERYFEEQARVLGERFRGKYCLASVRSVLPPKPETVSRFSAVMNESMLSNISYSGEAAKLLKLRARQLSVPASDRQLIDREHQRLDQIPFESELYQYLIAQRNFMYTLPRFMGVCYPSSCSRDDVRTTLQKTFDEQHLVVDIEYDCEQEEEAAWDWFITPRVVCYVILILLIAMVFLMSLARYILLSKMRTRRSKLPPGSPMAHLLDTLDMFSMDKCAGILFVKTKTASHTVDWTKVENNRSIAIDALRGFLALIAIYSQMTLLGCLPLPFMWSKWSDDMFPFFRSMLTQVFINTSIWSEAFYLIGAYLIALKCFENFRPKMGANGQQPSTTRMVLPNMFSFAIKRYIRLTMPMLAFMILNYVWPRLSNGFVFQDQSNRLMKACDTNGWTNMLLFHNHFQINETCLWPSHVSASFFQLHLLSYPLLVLCLASLWVQFNDQYDNEGKLSRRRDMLAKLLTGSAFGLMAAIGLLAVAYAAWQAQNERLIVPFLIDYIDYDNYQRVIEWMVLPTYNHATSYMVGIALAFVVIKRKAQNEMRQLEASAWFRGVAGTPGHYIERESSLESVPSSSTHELRDGLTFKGITKFRVSSAPSSICASSQQGYEDEEGAKTDASLERRHGNSWAWDVCKSTLASIVLLMSLSASWLWNGFGQPMSGEQTFWYVFGTKICFLLAFAFLFHEHIAVRRNSSNPWIITRFLVPIGRMSLTVFYLSWLVIWFDLLSSLHQWHPSHYFLFEKYNEIIFITLIVGMFVYGAFEGITKRIQYTIRLDRVHSDRKSEERRAELLAQLHANSAQGESDSSSKQLVLRQLLAKNNKRAVKPFESFFDSLDKAEVLAQKEEQLLGAASRRQSTVAGAKVAPGEMAKLDLSMAAGQQAIRDAELQRAGQSPRSSHSSATPGNLSPSDRYKLNAELRANYSFASINLYEKAGATGDLTNLNAAAHDPQASPAMSLNR